ncbi:Co2+/Mg2+ efflux protein ApaG [Solimonas sp. K1W22B-7]|uniref:Co2+/Mg2+ efflux protein ApaG n=1 Tax=Solimonas sp. K1W22B-7 TaxID=2303331 RepID=UPI000E330684|nr:Co2+/Mg2+ efflux protein ApaG [Solimonas sp. K1W22B-7]AXQ27279.1 Co2+/Mg2+ efflux protein ApaG [Solimonas sp. K1W22B-7]
MSDTLTHGVRIIVRPHYVAEQSNPAEDEYLFAYHITIRNEGERTVQLISRHWVITNGEGHVEEVRGPGVVGHQPVLQPGEQFQYSSGCPLGTPVGTMHGEFNMVVSETNQPFDAQINPFTLAAPRALN